MGWIRSQRLEIDRVFDLFPQRNGQAGSKPLALHRLEERIAALGLEAECSSGSPEHASHSDIRIYADTLRTYLTAQEIGVSN